MKPDANTLSKQPCRIMTLNPAQGSKRKIAQGWRGELGARHVRLVWCFRQRAKLIAFMREHVGDVEQLEDYIMLKSMFNTGKCLLGFHKGEWRYEKPKECLKYQVCENCQKRSTKIEHTWGDWAYHSENDCQQLRICRRCEGKEEQTVHVWGADAYYKKEKDCTAVNYCERCRAEKLYGIVHEWGEWVYTDADTCNQVQRCSRCETLGGKKQVQHNWDGWQNSAFYNARVNVCQHCGLMPLNFDSTTTYTLTMQDVDRLIIDFMRANDLESITRVIRANESYFVQPLSPVINAYIAFVSTHMPEGQLKESYALLSAVIILISAAGVETVLSQLNGVRPQPGQTPWELVISRIQATGNKSQGQSGLDPSLIGEWIYTEMLGGGEFSMVTDYHKVFAGDGSYGEYQHSVSAAMGSDRRTGLIKGTWSTQNNVMFIQLKNGRNHEIPYEFYGKKLILSINGETRSWEKAR